MLSNWSSVNFRRLVKSKVESNTNSDWLNSLVKQSELA